MSDQKREVLKRFYAAFNSHDLAALDDLCSPDLVDHNPNANQPAGLPGLKVSLTRFRESFPNMKVENQLTVIEGDYAMVRSLCAGDHEGELLGVAPTGRHIEFEAVDNWRFEDGRLAEVWHIEDRFKFLFKLGLITLPTAATY